ncbi:MAG: hypothetical protein R3362_07015 [Rhodothermales bacterium]|nr:hypothetical protein [Rhodothermales bacterium]
MIRAVPTSWFTWNFRLLQDDREVGRLRQSSWRERARFLVEDVRFELYREGLLGDFVLRFGESVLVRARKPSVLHRRFEFVFEGQAYTLEPASALSRVFVLRTATVEVGGVEPEGWVTRKAVVDLPKTLPLPVQAFAFWLVMLTWRRSAGAKG